jgi:hypothetical protein
MSAILAGKSGQDSCHRPDKLIVAEQSEMFLASYYRLTKWDIGLRVIMEVTMAATCSGIG